MDSLVRDCDKLGKHQASSYNKSIAALDAAIQSLESDSLRTARDKLTKAHTTSAEQLKELYNNVSKYGKHVEKAFKIDLGVVAESRAFEDKRQVLGESVLLHFLREGDFETARLFAQEAHLVLPQEILEQFESMYRVVAQIKQEPDHDLTAAIDWAVKNRRQLNKLGLSLEFTLHRLRFLQLVEDEQAMDALAYARQWFPQFSKSNSDSSLEPELELEPEPEPHAEEVEHLMGIFIFARRLSASPYVSMFDSQRWEDGARDFASAFCTLLGLASTSPLSVTACAGARALPILCKALNLLRDKRAEWSQQDELAVEVQLPDDMHFHSVFACPVSKEQATPANPPMMMPCGHVVCRASLEKLARGIRPGAAVAASGRFKCPYCPGMSTLNDAKPVYF